MSIVLKNAVNVGGKQYAGGDIVIGLSPDVEADLIGNGSAQAAEGAGVPPGLRMTEELYKALSSTQISGLQRRGDPRRLVAGRSGISFETGGGAADGGSNYTSHLSRTSNRVGPGGARNLQLVLPNLVANSAGETAIGNDVNFRAALEFETTPGGSRYTVPLTFGGSKRITVPGDIGYAESDPIPVELPPNTCFGVRIEQQVQAAGNLYGRGYATHGANYWLGSAGNAFADAAWNGVGDSVVYGNGSFSSVGLLKLYLPIAVIGVQITPTPSVVYLGDSILRGSGDSVVDEIIAGLSTGGPRSAGLQLTEPGIVLPYSNISRDGASLLYAMSDFFGADKTRILSVLKWATHVVCGLGNNDIASGPSLSVVKDRYTKVWAFLKAMGLRVSQRTLTPRTTGVWDSPQGQTIVNHYASNQLRGQLNAWLISGADGLVDEIVDVNAAVEDPMNLGKWRSDVQVTADGVHPNSVGHKLMRDVELQYTKKFVV